MSAFDPKRTIGKRLPRNFRRTNLTRYNAFPEPGGNETLPVQGVNRDGLWKHLARAKVVEHTEEHLLCIHCSLIEINLSQFCLS